MAKKLTPKDYDRWDGRVGIVMTNDAPTKKTTGKAKAKRTTAKKSK